MKSGIAAGSEASARVTELSRISRRRHILQKTRCRQAAAPEAELAAKMKVAQTSSKDHVAGIADEDDGGVTSMFLSIGQHQPLQVKMKYFFKPRRSWRPN